MKQDKNKKMFYVFIACITLSMVIIGATLAYFTASASDDNTIHGNAATVTFGLTVERITTVDMAFGLIPMRNDQAPKAVQNRCYDDMGNAGCQMYRITVTADSDTTMFLDGFVSLQNKEGVETRVASIYTDDDEETFNTAFTPDDFVDRENLSDEFLASNSKNDLGIKSGVRGDDESQTFSRDTDLDCFLISNQQIGGDAGRTRVFYIMVWVFDNGRDQNFMQGMQLAYQGSVVFVTAQGNEISATFD